MAAAIMSWQVYCFAEACRSGPPGRSPASRPEAIYAHRFTPLHRAACPRWPALTITGAGLSHGGEQPIDRGTADRELLLPHLQIEGQVTVAPQGLQQ
jgi:hypothetical protein